MRDPQRTPASSRRLKDKGYLAMSQVDISNLEHAGRSAMAWIPEGYDGRTHYQALLGAALPAFAILAAAAAFLVAAL